MRVFLRRLIGRLADRLRPASRDRDMEQEMQFHVDALSQEYMRAGMSEERARWEAGGGSAVSLG